MGSIRTLAGRGTLFLDFRSQGKRCREYTALPDTEANRKKLEKILTRIEAEISAGTFVYTNYFPDSQATPTDHSRCSPSSVERSSIGIVDVAGQHDKSKIASLPATPTLRTFTEQWVTEHQVEWRRSHLKSLRSTLDRHVIPYFGDKPVGAITKADVLAFRNHLASLPGRGAKAGLSNKRINGILGPLRQILEEAADRFGFTSPVQNYKPLRIRKTDVDPFTLDEVQKLLSASRPDFKDYFIVRFFTGMRTGEAHGLKWKYVDFTNRLILVRETFVLGEDEYTKTDGSQREIQMSQPVFDALQRMHAATSKLSEYVFCNRGGKPLDNKNFTDRVWYPLLRHLGLTERRPYQMRHTAATLWLASGEAPEWIARQLGHTSTEMLFKVYSRYVPNMTRRDGSAIDRLLASRFATGTAQSTSMSTTPGASQHADQGSPPTAQAPPPWQLSSRGPHALSNVSAF